MAHRKRARERECTGHLEIVEGPGPHLAIRVGLKNRAESARPCIFLLLYLSCISDNVIKLFIPIYD